MYVFQCSSQCYLQYPKLETTQMPKDRWVDSVINAMEPVFGFEKYGYLLFAKTWMELECHSKRSESDNKW